MIQEQENLEPADQSRNSLRHCYPVAAGVWICSCYVAPRFTTLC